MTLMRENSVPVISGLVTKPQPRAKLDSFDRKILQALAADGRISWRTLADRINLTLTPTLRRVRRLEAEGYILGYGAIIDEARMHGNISVSMMVTIEGDDEDIFDRFEQHILTLPCVTYCGRYAPGPNYIVIIYAISMDETCTLLKSIGSVEGVGKIDTMPMLRISRHMKPLASWPSKKKS